MKASFIPENHFVIRSAGLMDQNKIIVSEQDRTVLRALGTQVAEVIQAADEQEKRTRQAKKNALEWVRPLVICFPEVSWREILPASSLECTGKVARNWEMYLRQLLFIAGMHSDQCLPQSFEIGYVHGGFDWGIDMQQEGDLEHGSYRWEAPIKK